MLSKALDHALFERERRRDNRIAELSSEILLLQQRLEEALKERLRLMVERGDKPLEGQ